jgi:hypothetical protein
MRWKATWLAGAVLALAGTNFGQDQGAPEITAPAQKSIEKGIRWLLENQNRDGSWGCERGQPPSVALTALSTLALMASGSTPDRGPYQDAIRKAVKWVESKQERSGYLGAFDSTAMGKCFEHSCGTLMLSQLLGMASPQRLLDQGRAEDERRRISLNKALEVLEGMQNSDGGWGSQPKANSDIGITAMSYLAFQAGTSCGARNSKADLKKLRAFAKSARAEGARMYTLASILRVEYGLGKWDGELPNMRGRFLKMRYGQDHGRMSEWDYLAAFYSVGAFLHDESEPSWEKWYAYTRDHLVRIQTQEGSWIVEYCLHCKVFATSLALLSLQMPTRILPLHQY